MEKSPHAQRVLQLMDQDHSYIQALDIVMIQMKNELEKELDFYI